MRSSIVDPPVERTLPRYPGKGATPGASVRGVRRLSDKFANGVRGPLFFDPIRDWILRTACADCSFCERQRGRWL